MDWKITNMGSDSIRVAGSVLLPGRWLTIIRTDHVPMSTRGPSMVRVAAGISVIVKGFDDPVDGKFVMESGFFISFEHGDDVNTPMIERLSRAMGLALPVCECGFATAGGFRHSDWCPMRADELAMEEGGKLV